MVNNYRNNKTIEHAGTGAQIDAGLRTYMLQVFSYMFVGLFLTGGVAYLGATIPALKSLLFTVDQSGFVQPSGFTWVLLFVQLGMVFYLSARVFHMSSTNARALFWIYSGIMGLSLSSVFMVYTGASLYRTFLVTSATFGAMALYGYTTKRNLLTFGSFFLMGLIGLIIASVVNIFMQSSAMEFIISAFGVLLFTGLTAYDAQVIKVLYYQGDTSEEGQKQKAIIGALRLYLDFINLFLFFLRFLGERR
jgi:FtsH-binding integral membrane protein